VVDILGELNEVQREAVSNYTGPSLVIAGAGSGKTRVLTYRIAYLLDQGIPAHNILALTFTNKAAREMKERIGLLVGDKAARSLWMGTFHSIFARILRKEGYRFGYESNFTIYDTLDSKNLIKTIIKELDLNPENYKPGEIYSRISSAKNNLITPRAYSSNQTLQAKDAGANKPRLADIYKHYFLRCRKAGAMDFDDLLLNTNILFRDFPDVLKEYQVKFKFLLVDEYQDTNLSQYLIVKKLVENHKNICVVGDDAQSIYAFRGAKIENILNFKSDYPGHKIYKLEQNYRSTQNIVNAANSLIAKNLGQIKKKVWSSNETGDRVKVIKAATDGEEGFLVSGIIQDTIHEKQANYSDFAILYRTNAQSRIFEESLRKRNIPYKVYGSLSFYQRKEIKDLIAYFRAAVNHNDEEAMKRIINYPTRGIGNTTLNKLLEFSNTSGIPLWEIISHPEKHEIKINKGTQSKLKTFALKIEEFSKEIHLLPAFELANKVASGSGIIHEMRTGNTPENISKLQNIEELLNSIKEVSNQTDPNTIFTLDMYLENIALLTDADNDKPDDINKVTLMTIHAAKGLEFDHVFVAGLEEELFPSRLSLATQQELEEERRLFYVALTRAKKRAVLSYSNTRFKWGNSTSCNPSRFLREIDSKFVEMPVDDSAMGNLVATPPGSNQARKFKNPYLKKRDNLGTRGMIRQNMTRLQDVKNQVPSAQTPFEANDPASIKAGMSVEHPRFGKGKVLRIEDNNTKAFILFHEAGEKKLLLQYAKLKILK